MKIVSPFPALFQSNRIPCEFYLKTKHELKPGSRRSRSAGDLVGLLF
ncbi:MAG: hypothetical protein AVDCRST_MAG93-9402, partial [uncultured Chloroflexia bacterium]